MLARPSTGLNLVHYCPVSPHELQNVDVPTCSEHSTGRQVQICGPHGQRSLDVCSGAWVRNNGRRATAGSVEFPRKYHMLEFPLVVAVDAEDKRKRGAFQNQCRRRRSMYLRCLSLLISGDIVRQSKSDERRSTNSFATSSSTPSPSCRKG